MWLFLSHTLSTHLFFFHFSAFFVGVYFGFFFYFSVGIYLSHFRPSMITVDLPD